MTAQPSSPEPTQPPATQPAPSQPGLVPTGAASLPSQAVAPEPAAVDPASLAVMLNGISRRFGEVVAVNGVSFNVPTGAIVGLIVPSGSGKTTTIRILTGAIAPDSGTVRVLGQDPRHYSRRTREMIGYMPQSFVLYPDLTTRENIDFIAALFGIAPWVRGRRVDEVLKLVDLWEARGRKASALSGGMQRRLELACALVHRPRLLILDEPTAGIDPILRTRVWQELGSLRQSGVTVLVTTQYVSEAEYCDAVALISEGELVAFATPDDMRKLALGGDVIEIATRAPIDARAIPVPEGIVSIRQQGPRELLFVTSDAGVATPRVMEAIESTGGSVEYSREYRPTFDEVFAALVTAHAEGEGGPPPAGDVAANPLIAARPR